MPARKEYRDSLLSILCVISWIVIIFRIFKFMDKDTDLTLTYFFTIGIGVIGGIILIFIRLLKRRNLKYHFIYNLFGTFNILVGYLGLALFALSVNPRALHGDGMFRNRPGNIQRHLSAGNKTTW